jgi:manganese/zinc/iron transport system substrate-binding protein
MMRRLVLVAAATLLAGACAPASTDSRPLAERPVRIVATTSLVADLARQIGGDRVEVHGLMGPGVDPHLYRARESDVQRMVGADLILYNGLHLEGKMGDVLEQMRGRGVAVAAVAEAIPDSLLLSADGGNGVADPHVWMDVARWAHAARAAADALAALDPTHADAYRARAAAYRARLDTLDAEVRDRIASLPPARRVLVTAHDAFTYFGDAYGVDVRGLQGISTAAEAGTADVRALADFVAERGVPALFVESSVPPRSIEAVLAAIQARGAEVRLGGSLYSDALGDAASGADTYEGMIRHNVTTIVDALGGPDA